MPEANGAPMTTETPRAAHIETPDDPSTWRVSFAVAPGTKLAAALGVERLDVVSRHHQGVRGLGPRWSASAVDDEGLIEGIERADHPFALGVQWHPELSPAGGPQGRLFRSLVAAARSAARPAARAAND